MNIEKLKEQEARLWGMVKEARDIYDRLIMEWSDSKKLLDNAQREEEIRQAAEALAKSQQPTTTP